LHKKSWLEVQFMITKEQIFESLRDLQDPHYHKSLPELNFIRDVVVNDEKVAMTVILSAQDDEMKAQLKENVTNRLSALGAHNVHIRFRLISDFERSELENANKRAGQGDKGMDEMQQRRQAQMRAEGMPKLLGPESGTHFIAVASGKGGVGKSTVTVNLAVALARLGRRVGLIDADIYGFSVPDMMGIEERPELVDNLIHPVERFGVKIISMGFFVEDNAPIIWRGPMLGKMLRNFFNEVYWGELDYVLLDLPPGTGDIALDVHQMIPQSKEILVTTPHATAAFVAARAGAMAKQTNHDILGIVENMAYYECGQCGNKDYIFGRGGGAKLAEELHADLLAQIPLGAPDNHPSEADFSPSVYKAESQAGKIYLDMAEKVIDKLER
jgi:ATP-binding protein involved in chromosome partitioning